jgi:hypothetical protein
MTARSHCVPTSVSRSRLRLFCSQRRATSMHDGNIGSVHNSAERQGLLLAGASSLLRLWADVPDHLWEG